MQGLSDISKAALELSLDERTILANRLAESLHAETDPAIEDAWKKEIGRRLEDVRSGKVELIDGHEGLARVRRRRL